MGYAPSLRPCPCPMSCNENDVQTYDNAVNSYLAVSYAAVGLTVVNFVIMRCYLFKNFRTLPTQTIRGFVLLEYVLAMVKVAAGALLLSVFYPRCPSDCSCRSFVPIYPYLCFVIAGLWVMNVMRVSK